MSIIEKKEKNLNQLINKLNTLTSTYSQSTYEVEKIITEKNELSRKKNMLEKKNQVTTIICDLCILHNIKLIYVSSMQIYKNYGKNNLHINSKINLKNLYNEEIKIEDEIELDNLPNFLDENIYKIEKTINNFIRNIILIIEDDKVLDVGISVKKKNYEMPIGKKYITLIQLLKKF